MLDGCRKIDPRWLVTVLICECESCQVVKAEATLIIFHHLVGIWTKIDLQRRDGGFGQVGLGRGVMVRGKGS